VPACREPPSKSGTLQPEWSTWNCRGNHLIDRLTLVSVLDDQNRDLTMTVSGLHHESFIATAFLRLFDNPRSKSLNLTVAVSKIINASSSPASAPQSTLISDQLFPCKPG